MAKRKVNDIIYELDNDDIEISSEDEAKGNKIKRSDKQISNKTTLSQSILSTYKDDVIVLNSFLEDSFNTESESNSQNGGKYSPNDILIENEQITINDEIDSTGIETFNKDPKKCPETIILNEDIAVDSPSSINESSEIGCENRKPLITVRFRNYELANKYKSQIKLFIIDLIKLDNKQTDVFVNDTESDLEIWPEDLCDINQSAPEMNTMDSLFFVDTDPNEEARPDIPKYTQGATVISNETTELPEPATVSRRGPICFNCDGDHFLRDCKLPRNNTRIAGKRKNITNKLGRYHVEDEQKYGHLIPGRISSQLRHALGLKRHELPLHIYRMRMLGYPPGWLEEARICHSGITMFDSAGNEILDAEDEEGQICEAGSKDKFDIKKILDFPGFNVPASSRYKEEGDMLGVPPMSEHDSKLLMIETLAPNAMKAYKRKKLTFFPSGPKIDSMSNSQAEMELDSGDEVTEFPSVPPLPDDVPPPPPPPPENPPPPPENPPPPPVNPPALPKNLPPPPKNPLPPNNPLTPPTDNPLPQPPLSPLPTKNGQDSIVLKIKDNNGKESVKMISITSVADIPVPDEDLVAVDEVIEEGSGRSSPTLDDLEEKKKRLLDALDEQSPTNIDTENNGTQKQTSVESQTDYVPEGTPLPSLPETSACETPKTLTPECSKTNSAVKTLLFGTPIINIASPYMKVPSDDKFAKDICDVINFENLPNSTGKYKKICSLLKKVKSEVDRIQES